MNGWVVVDEALDVFDALAENHRIARDAAVRELALVAQACDQWVVDESAVEEAAEKLVTGGAEGTAMVGEFLALELAGLLEISPTSAALRVRGVLDLRDRHPELWAYTMAGGVEPWRALKVAARCSAAGLSGDAARWVDHQVAVALAALPWGRVLRSLEGLIVRADAALAAERERRQRARRTVWFGDHADGGSTLYARLDAEAALALQRTIDAVADALPQLLDRGAAEPLEHRRATALGVLADPQAAVDLLAGVGDGRPTNRTATLVVHLSAEDLAAEDVPDPAPASEGRPGVVARVEGVGPLAADTVRRFLSDSTVVVRPVVDLNTIPPVDAYEAPARLRQLVLARNPVEVFPFSARPAGGLDLDHTVPYDHQAPPGARQTSADNLGPLSRKTHRAKTSGAWRVEQREPGEYWWTSRHGFRYLVTPEGTTALGRADRPAPTRSG